MSQLFIRSESIFGLNKIFRSMKILYYLREISKLFDWYFLLPQIKRIQLNYIIILTIVITLTYFNDKRHSENYAILSSRIDSVNNNRAKEQEKYTAKLEYYTDKFNSLLVVLIQQKKEIKQIKED
jgi:hypothetical protein